MRYWTRPATTKGPRAPPTHARRTRVARVTNIGLEYHPKRQYSIYRWSLVALTLAARCTAVSQSGEDAEAGKAAACRGDRSRRPAGTLPAAPSACLCHECEAKGISSSPLTEDASCCESTTTRNATNKHSTEPGVRGRSEGGVAAARLRALPAPLRYPLQRLRRGFLPSDYKSLTDSDSRTKSPYRYPRPRGPFANMQPDPPV